LEYGSKLLARILEINLDHSSIDIIYIAIRAYRIITDPDCGFYKNASCSTQENFSDLYRDLAALFEPRILKLYHIILSMMGSDVLGVSKVVFEPASLDGQKQGKREFRTDVLEDNVFLNICQELRQMNNISPIADTVSDAIDFCSDDTEGDLSPSFNHKQKAPYSSEIEIDEKVGAFLKNWKKKSESNTLNAEDFFVAPWAPEKSNNVNSIVSLEENVILATFEEIIKLIPASPYSQVIKGDYFIGSLLYHSTPAIQNTASVSIQKVIKFNPKYRLR
jgi:hypothetical protein